MSKLAGAMDKSIRGKAMTFLQKLAENDALPGLHVEPIASAADQRVRTGRVDDGWRAVMFRADHDGETHYVIHGVWPHDQAIAIARKVRLTVNPVNGLPQFEDAPAPTEHPTIVVAPPVERPLLARHGYQLADLTDRLGVPAEVATQALAVTSEDALLDLAARHEGWLGTILVSLGAGDSLDEIAATMELSEGTSDDTDQGLLDSLRRPAAQLQFTIIGDQQELRRVIEGGDFAAWRVFLHPEQRRYVDRSYSGPFRLTGGAGTGKTVVLVHRARALLRRDPSTRIVLTTFTTNLAESLRDSLRQLDPDLPIADRPGAAGVYVAGVDALAAAVLRAGGAAVDEAMREVLGEARTSRTPRPPSTRWRDVVEASATELPAEAANETFLTGEYGQVVLPNRITDEAGYLRVRRSGRGVALDRRKRSQVWSLIAAYRAQCRVDGSLDFPEASAVAACHLGHVGPLVDHVLVDEGQDLSPTHWQMLRALVGEHADDLFIAEDAHQRIYGARLVLARYGIKIVGRSRRLTLNYRTTAENLRYALDRLAGGQYTDLEDQWEEATYRSVRSGPNPQVSTVGSLSDELDHVAGQARRWVDEKVPPETIAVLVPDRALRERVVASLDAKGVPAAALDRGRPPTDRVLVMTTHRAKGMEFARVILAKGGRTPAEQERRRVLDDKERTDLELRDRSLIYVAATRARDELVVVDRR
ncbi:DNA helicase [Actinocatenispora thailandica]|uniref:DNA 3'-5' helicase n=2 Tax=Actinocatenispora thailandica TaxID=227318 RepID=A0A7R7DSU5_9ACTN|nr:DNA helicase [Actinocatenispora thailandica]